VVVGDVLGLIVDSNVELIVGVKVRMELGSTVDSSVGHALRSVLLDKLVGSAVGKIYDTSNGSMLADELVIIVGFEERIEVGNWVGVENGIEESIKLEYDDVGLIDGAALDCEVGSILDT